MLSCSPPLSVHVSALRARDEIAARLNACSVVSRRNPHWTRNNRNVSVMQVMIHAADCHSTVFTCQHKGGGSDWRVWVGFLLQANRSLPSVFSFKRQLLRRISDSVGLLHFVPFSCCMWRRLFYSSRCLVDPCPVDFHSALD